MLYDRSYMKGSGNLRVSTFTDFIKYLLVGSFILFFLIGLIMPSSGKAGIPDYIRFIAFSHDGATSLYFWTILSYGLMHDGILHLFANLLGLHFITRQVESDMDKNDFRWLVVLTLIFGAVVWLIFNQQGGSLVGASALVLGSLSYFCLRKPDQPITFLLFFVLPVTLRPKIILLAVLGYEVYYFISSELIHSQISNVAHSAHLGGMLAGAFCFYKVKRGNGFPRFRFVSSPRVQTNVKKRRLKPNEFTVDFANQEKLQKAVDEILDKINERGFGSLTAKEKKILDKAKGLLRK